MFSIINLKMTNENRAETCSWFYVINIHTSSTLYLCHTNIHTIPIYQACLIADIAAGTVACLQVTGGGKIQRLAQPLGSAKATRDRSASYFLYSLTRLTSHSARYFMWITKAFRHMSTWLYFSHVTYDTVWPCRWVSFSIYWRHFTLSYLSIV